MVLAMAPQIETVTPENPADLARQLVADPVYQLK
jgi:hypothetical protein